MGDSYDFVFQNMEKAILKNKIEVMSDYVFVIKSKPNIERFLFVATLAEEDIETEVPLGVKFSAIRGMIQKNLENMKETVVKKLDEKLERQVGGLKENLGGLRENLVGLKEDLHTRDAKLEKSIATMIDERVGTKEVEIDKQMPLIHSRVEDKAGGLEEKFDSRVGGLESTVGGLKVKVGGLEAKVGGLQGDVLEIKGDVQEMKGLLELQMQLLQKLASD